MKFLIGMTLAATLVLTQARAADDVVKIGVILPMSGTFTLIGQEVQNGIKVYMDQHGDRVAGKKIELIVRDDQAIADQAKRIAQELIVNDKVQMIAGIGATPSGFAAAPIVTQAKIPMIVMAAGASAITSASPYAVRTSFTNAQVASVAGDYFGRHGIKTAVTLVSDFAPGHDNETWFTNTFEAAGGKVTDKLRVPFANPEFAPYLQKAADAKPSGLFIFVPTGQNGQLMRQFNERGLAQAGIKLLATGDVVDESLIDQIGPAAIGVESAYHYSDAHPSDLNRKFVADFEKVSNGLRANMMGVGGYDGMALIYKALEKTGGVADGPRLIEAMKGLAWESPRGPVSIDPETRDLVQNVYLRRVEKMGDRLVNTEFETYPAVKDPVKAAK